MKKVGSFLFLFIILWTAQYLAATDYYVDSNGGNDSNSGLSPQAAWRTIGKINGSMNLFGGGDNILFKRGETWTDAALNITRGGAGGSYLTFKAYGSGNKPRIDCGPRGISHGILITYSNVNYVVIENFEILNAACGIGVVSSFRTNIIVRDCHIHHMSANGIIFREVDGYEISGCVVHDCGNSGIGMLGSAANQITNGRIMNNTCYNFETNDAISIHRSDDGYECGPNHYFYNNTCYNAAEDGLDITSGTYIILRNNTTYNNDGKAFLIGSVVPQDRYVWIEGHYSREENKRGFYFGGNKKITMIKSVCWNPAQRVFHYGGYSGSDDVHIYNNTFIYDYRSQYVVVGDTGADNDNLTFKNNIIMSNDNDPSVYLVSYSGGNSPANTNSFWDHNCFWHVDGNANARRWTDSVNGTQSWTMWRANYGLEQNGMFANPRLVNISGENFTLQSTSPCIDAGGWVATITSPSGSGRSFRVDDATPFHDGLGLTTGSMIQLEGQADPVRVTRVDYNTDTLTVSSTVSWICGDGVAFEFNGARPDIGAFERSGDVIIPLEAWADATPGSGEAPLSVAFTGSVSGGTSPYTYRWTFGDGGSSTSRTPSHTYSSPGTYTATFTVTESNDIQDSDSVTITASAPAPLAAGIVASPTSGTAPLTVNFTGSVSGGTSPYTYRWTFGDGGSSTSRTPSYTYSSPGTYTATFTATDSGGSQDSASVGIQVTAPPSPEQVRLTLSVITGRPATGQGGTVTPSPGTHTYDKGSSVSISTDPSGGFRFARWLGDIGEAYAGRKKLTFSINQDKKLSALFCSLCGDVNGDLRISPLDSQAAFDIFLGKNENPTICQLENGDVNGDGTRSDPYISPADAQAIFIKYLGIRELPCDCSYNIRTEGLTKMGEGIETAAHNKPLQEIHLIVDEPRKISSTEIQVPIVINNPCDMDAFGFDFHYPSDTFEFAGVAKTDLVRNFYQVDGNGLEEGLVRVGGYSSEPIATDSGGELVILVFKLKKKRIDGSVMMYIGNTYDDLEKAYHENPRFSSGTKKATKHVRR